MTGETMSDPAGIVRESCGLMAKRDPALLRPFLAEDIVYHNTGMAGCVGAAAVLENLSGQFARYPDSYAYKMINLAIDGDTVLTERLDMIRTPNGVRGYRSWAPSLFAPERSPVGRITGTQRCPRR
jgi:limonene-1,2-epoxide hydrolase